MIAAFDGWIIFEHRELAFWGARSFSLSRIIIEQRRPHVCYRIPSKTNFGNKGPKKSVKKVASVQTNSYYFHTTNEFTSWPGGSARGRVSTKGSNAEKGQETKERVKREITSIREKGKDQDSQDLKLWDLTNYWI